MYMYEKQWITVRDVTEFKESAGDGLDHVALRLCLDDCGG